MSQHDMHMLKMSKRFSKTYPFNIYKLNQVSQYLPSTLFHAISLISDSLLSIEYSDQIMSIF